ncbi:MAG TPA: hypothetical protein PKM63_04775 [Panacibacter sp.]|nr:hypothetical protein [Panacibacter sp.]
MIVYRILSVFVNLFSALIAVITLFGVMYAIANPAALLQCFLFIGVTLYGWFANRFHRHVLLQEERLPRRQKDWLQVNAIVAFIFCVLGISNAVYVYRNPNIFDDVLKQLPPEMAASQQLLLNISTGLFVCCLLLAIHIAWTYILVRKHAAYFTDEA